MLVLGLLLGALLGGTLMESFNGVWFGAALGALLARSLQQGRRLTELGEQLKALEARWEAAATPPPARPVAQPAPPPPAAAPLTAHGLPAAAPPSDALWAGQRAQAAPPLTGLPTQPPAEITAPAANAAPAPRPRAPQPPPAAAPAAMVWPAWALRLAAANTIVKVGLAMLFLGLAFLARYAAERVSVPLEFRLVGIGLTGLALLGIGWHLRLKRRGYALLMQGGGVAVMYLTLFAAARLFDLVALGPSFGLMVAIALLAAALAVLQNAQGLAVMGTVGGYATPLLLSTGSGQIEVLLGYYLVLGLGVACIAWAKHWPRLNLLAFGFTAVVAMSWGLERYTPAHFGMAQGYLLAFWALFTGLLLLPGRKAALPEAWVNATLLFGVPVLGASLQYALLRPNHNAIALAALLIGGAYIALATWARQRQAHRTVFEAFVALGAVFATLVIPFALSAEATAGAWALEGLGALWLGLRQRRRLVVASGLGLMLLGGCSLLGALNGLWGSGHWPSSLLNALLLAAAGLGGARLLQRNGAWDAHLEALRLPAVLVGWGTLWLLVAAGVVTDRAVPAPHAWAVSVALVALVAGLLLALQRRWGWPLAAWPTALLLPFWLLAGLAGAAAHGAPLLHGGWWALPLALLAQGGVLHITAPHWPLGLRRATHAGSLLALALLGALQGRWETAGWGDDVSAWGWLGWLLVPALLLAAVLHQQRHAGPAQAWPLRLMPKAYAEDAGVALATALALWALLANWGSNGSAQPLPYVPLLNPLDIGVGAALLALTAWLRSAAASAWAAQPDRVLAWSAGALGFLWLNGMLIRSFHHWDGVAYQPSAWMASWAVQTGLALLWSLLALVLMGLAHRRQMRAPWLVGAGLLGAVVVKLLLIDLQGTGTVMRIVSFIGVGVLMLVIGYVAPLPTATGIEGDVKENPAA